MINFFKAMSILLNNSKNKYKFLKEKYICTEKSINNISSINIFSNKNIPSFKNSAMDGYAININYLNNKIEQLYFFKIIKKIHAGDFFEKKNMYSNDAVEIMTGARIPSNLNAVIKYEDVLKNNDINFFTTKIVKHFENIKLIGDDIKIGDKIIGKGKILNMSDITALSTIEKKKIKIFKNPNIYLINTGNELSDKINESNLMSISNSSRAYIISFLKNLNINLKNLQTIKDDVKKFIDHIKIIWSLNYLSIFITTGAVSKGKSDFIPLILKFLGIKILFHSVNIKPGKPLLFGNFKNFIFFFCLPGNPISTIVGTRFFLYPFIMLLLGQNLEEPIKLDIYNEINNKKDSFLKSFSYFKDNKLINLILNNQESFKVKPMLKANSFTFIKKNENKRYIYFNYTTRT
ncbi:MAG TPA: molybdopterin-binding protein [Candidatus Azoamicus sp. MARI]